MASNTINDSLLGTGDLVCPYAECRKLFSTRYNLSKHVNVHHKKILNFTCQRCGRAFGYKHTLRNHVALHLKRLSRCEQPLQEALLHLTSKLVSCNWSDWSMGSKQQRANHEGESPSSYPL